MNYKILIVLLFVIVFGTVGAYLFLEKPACFFPSEEIITSFDECIEAGYPVMESYPRQCKASDGESFVEDVGNIIEKMNLIRVNSPFPNGVISSPLVITGEARGFWFFEADFPIILTDWDGRIIAEVPAQAQGDWMTEGFVPFIATLEFEKPYSEEDVPDFMKRGNIIFQKDNPYDLPEYDDALEFPVFFE